MKNQKLKIISATVILILVLFLHAFADINGVLQMVAGMSAGFLFGSASTNTS